MLKVYVIAKDGVQEVQDIATARQRAKEKQGFVWIDLRSYTEDEVKKVADRCGFHSLAVESVMSPYTRPHLSEYEDHFHVNFTYVEVADDEFKPLEFHVFLAQDYVVTASDNGSGRLVDEVLNSYRDTPTMAERGAFYALYLLVEPLTDSYLQVAEDLDDEVDGIEDQMLERATQETLQRLFRVKRKLFELRRYLGPQRDVYNELARREFPFLEKKYQLHFQDVYNRMIRVFDVTDTARDITSGTLDLYQSTVSNRLNDIVKVLTVFAVILGMLTLITGFFGMNFRDFPWLRVPHAIPIVIGGMVVLSIAMLFWFRKKKWL